MADDDIGALEVAARNPDPTLTPTPDTDADTRHRPPTPDADAHADTNADTGDDQHHWHADDHTPTPIDQHRYTPQHQRPRRCQRQRQRRVSSNSTHLLSTPLRLSCTRGQCAGPAFRPCQLNRRRSRCASEDNTAEQKGDYTFVAGRLIFAPERRRSPLKSWSTRTTIRKGSSLRPSCYSIPRAAQWARPEQQRF